MHRLLFLETSFFSQAPALNVLQKKAGLPHSLRRVQILYDKRAQAAHKNSCGAAEFFRRAASYLKI